MTMQNVGPQSRRALLGAAFGGLAALAAQALRPMGAAADGESVRVGGKYRQAASPTLLENGRNDRPVFIARSRGSGRALHGQSTHGVGVHGYATDGVGVRAGSGSGVALRVDGRIQVKASGVVSISLSPSEVVYPGVKVLASSIVLLTPLQDMGGLRWWYELSPVNDYITVSLSSLPGGTRKLAWLLLG